MTDGQKYKPLAKDTNETCSLAVQIEINLANYFNRSENSIS